MTTRLRLPHRLGRWPHPARALAGWVGSLGMLLGGCASRQLIVPLIPPLISSPKASILWTEPFDRLDPWRWREIEVSGRRTEYQVLQHEQRSALQARSAAGASILLSAVRFDPDTYEWISWDWRVDQPVTGEDLTRKEGSDAAARVYVYFKTRGLPWQKRNIDYVWSSELPVGTILTSAHASTSKIIVAESGSEHLGQWRHVERNVEEDYRACFHKNPPQVIAIGLMSDTDSTGGEALAYFDELQVSRRP